MWKRASVTIAAAAFAMVTTVEKARADNCRATKPEEPIQLLIDHSPFEGEWRLSGHSGPTRMSFNELADVPYVIWHPGDRHGKLHTRREHAVSFPGEDRVTFDSGTPGTFELTLSPDCHLEGAQSHPNGRVSHRLVPSASSSTRISGEKSPEFSSNAEFVEYLLRRSPFEGRWTWSDREGSFSISFVMESNALLGDSVLISSRGEPFSEQVSVSVRNPSLLAFRKKNGTLVQLEADEAGLLRGVIVTPDQAVLITTITSATAATATAD